MRVCFVLVFFFRVGLFFVSCYSFAIQSIPVPARFCFHLANAYEDPENGEVVVDLAEAHYLKLDNEEESDLPVWDTIGESGKKCSNLKYILLLVLVCTSFSFETSALYGPSYFCRRNMSMQGGCKYVEGGVQICRCRGGANMSMQGGWGCR